jgi:hypothetical protein
MFQDTLAIDHFLSHETSSGEHSKTSVVDFLRLKGQKLIWIGRLETEGIEANITRGVVFTQQTNIPKILTLSWVFPSVLGTVELQFANANTKDTYSGRPLRKVGDGRSLDGAIEEGGSPTASPARNQSQPTYQRPWVSSASR